MTMTDMRDENMLEQMFAEARADAPPASDAFLARIMADAEAEQARILAPQPPERRPVLQAFVAALAGGWAGLGGLAAASLAGLWIGLAPPDLIQNLAPGLYGDTVSVPLLGDTSTYWAEYDS